MAAINRAFAQGSLFLIRLYQFFLSPLVGHHCGFFPTCSCYSREAIQRFGILKGFYLSLGRVLRCHPLHAGGIDFVPLEK